MVAIAVLGPTIIVGCDISREQFARILPTLESARRRTVDLYDVFCGVCTLEKRASGECCAVHLLPVFPAAGRSGPFWSKS